MPSTPNYKASILKLDDHMGKAIQVLNDEPSKIVLVTDEECKLHGTITDGDIRRALLRHCDMATKLSDVMFKNPTVAFVEDGYDHILELMKSKDVLQIPIVNSDRMIVGLETFQGILEHPKIDNPVVLMAGGFGKRLKPLTDKLPKPMLQIGGEPILEKILNQFVVAGFHKFYFSTHYKAEVVSNYFGDGSNWRVSIEYIYEEKPLGTAGGLGLLPESLPKLPIVVMNSDLLTNVNFEQLLNFHNKQSSIATMCVREYEFQVPYGVVNSVQHYVTSITEKPVYKNFVNAGIYVLNHSVLKNIDGIRYVDMPDVLKKCISQGKKVSMFPLYESWNDIGRIKEFELASDDVT